ncbi:hypothetical protein [Streptomyces sp. NPDC086182]|uniref:hypothetical protein n=1 Tax=Streptomyces sp. NPDC086182 TaxID=3155058 RepID=UPI00343BFA93
MRRTARVLYATALAGAALGAAASGASADPVAEVSPGSVEPGGTVTIRVTCDAIGGSPPDFIDAGSQGFQEGKVQLHRVEGADPNAGGAASYSGTALISSGGSGESDAGAGTAADPAAAGSGAGRGSAGVSSGPMGPGTSGASDAKNPDAASTEAVDPAPGGANTVAPDAFAPAPVAGDPVVPDPLTPGAVGAESAGPDTVGPDDLGPDTVGPDTVGPDSVGPDTAAPGTAAPGTAVPDTVGPDKAGPDAGGADGPWNVDGVCPAPPGGQGKQWTASYSVARGGTATHGPDDGTGSGTGAGTGTGAGGRPPTVQRGVQAGEGGVFTDSVPALITGSVLIAGAVGAAAYRLHRLRRRRA